MLKYYTKLKSALTFLSIAALSFQIKTNANTSTKNQV